jgi:nucleoside-diphosphate-sugar epimerase
MMARIGVLGASGFVGRAVVEALDGHDVLPVRTPRLTTSARTSVALIEQAAEHPAVTELATAFVGCDVVVNAAGDPDASSLDLDGLYAANALIPRVALVASAVAGVPRFVHVSSAVVQNDKPVLDQSEDLRPFSPYSAAKVAGEQVLRDGLPPGVTVVRYRPPSVHAPGRRVTRMIARIARSPMATVAGPGDSPSPQAQLPNVAAAVAFLATTDLTPPAVVVHPSEGVTTGGLMRDLSGGREPRHLPPVLARLVVRMAKLAGRVHRPTAANARRVELLWFGQGQSASWLDDSGFVPPVGPEGWPLLVEEASA